MKYEKLCNDILAQIPVSNIYDVFHCVTRLRFHLKDRSTINKEELEKINGIIQVKEVGDQLQLVIGPHVTDVYDEFCEMTNLTKNDEVPEDTEVVANKDDRKFSTKLFDHLSAIFMPIIPAFCACGMIKCITLLLTVSGLLPETDGVITVLNIAGDVPFYFLPFFVGYTTAKLVKLNEVFGFIIAGTLLSPMILNQAGESIQFMFFDIPCFAYTSTVFPVLLSVVAFSYVYKGIDHFMPRSLSLVFSGTLALIIAIPVILLVIAPLGNYASIYVTRFVGFLFDVSGPVAGAVLTGFMPFITMAGGLGIGPMTLVNFAELGYDFIFPAFFLNNMAVAGATIAAALVIKDPAMKTAAFSSGGLGILGITEPALYGIDVKYKTALTGACVGGAIAGALYMLLNVKCYLFAMPGIFSLPAYIHDDNNLIMIIICVVIAFVSAFLYSYIFTKKSCKGGC